MSGARNGNGSSSERRRRQILSNPGVGGVVVVDEVLVEDVDVELVTVVDVDVDEVVVGTTVPAPKMLM